MILRVPSCEGILGRIKHLGVLRLFLRDLKEGRLSYLLTSGTGSKINISRYLLGEDKRKASNIVLNGDFFLLVLKVSQ